MLVWDAGKSECLAVMVWIGVQDLPHYESRLTSYAGVSLKKRLIELSYARIAIEPVFGEVGTCRSKGTIATSGVSKGFKIFTNFEIG